MTPRRYYLVIVGLLMPAAYARAPMSAATAPAVPLPTSPARHLGEFTSSGVRNSAGALRPIHQSSVALQPPSMAQLPK